jgi:hypothetical protein
MKTPYQTAPTRAFWARSVSRPAPSDIDPAAGASFQITPETKVGTAGSCFAQNIAKYMRRIGLTPFVTEPAHPTVAKLGEAFHYGVYSARYGNLYTARQAVQLFRRAFGTFTPAEAPWRNKAGAYVDPFRPLIPEGFASLREYERDREQHFAAVRKLFTELDVLVFTLGLTESWLALADGAVFPSCPGTAEGEWDPARYAFHNFTVAEVAADLDELVALMRSVNPNAKMMLTVSPVPLVATATQHHVLTATVYSKSVLRVAAQMAADAHEGVDYFHSYEIITGPHAPPEYYAADRRNVTDVAVGHVMRVFRKHYLGQLAEAPPAEAPAAPPAPADSATERARAAQDAICDEMYNDMELKPTPA